MSGKPHLIGIAGPSGAGKSFLAEHLGRALVAPVLSLDHYYRDLSHLPYKARAQSNFDDPAALEDELLISQIRELGEGRSVEIPIYDFGQHTRTGETRLFVPGRYVIIEGIFTLYWRELRKLLGTGVYVEANEKLCLERRLERDVRERGRTPESVFEQVRSSVLPMTRQYVQPTRSYADLVVSGAVEIEGSVRKVLEHIQQHMQPSRKTSVVK
jgi:uridine kinase